MNFDETESNSDFESSNLFQRFFSSVYTDNFDKSRLVTNFFDNIKNFPDLHLTNLSYWLNTPDGMLDVIKSLKDNGSNVPDNIAVLLIKECK